MLPHSPNAPRQIPRNLDRGVAGADRTPRIRSRRRQPRAAGARPTSRRATYTIRTRSEHTNPVRVHDATTIADSFGGSSYAAAARRSSRSASV